MDVANFQIPKQWPRDAKAFARGAICEISELRSGMKQMMTDFVGLQTAFEKAQGEIQELKAKLATNSSNSSSPPSMDPPGTPKPEAKPSGRKQGAQKGHRGAGRSLYPPERINNTKDVFPSQCPLSGKSLGPEDLVSSSNLWAWSSSNAPGTGIFNEFFGYSACLQQHPENLLFEKFLELFPVTKPGLSRMRSHPENAHPSSECSNVDELRGHRRRSVWRPRRRALRPPDRKP